MSNYKIAPATLADVATLNGKAISTITNKDIDLQSIFGADWNQLKYIEVYVDLGTGAHAATIKVLNDTSSTYTTARLCGKRFSEGVAQLTGVDGNNGPVIIAAKPTKRYLRVQVINGAVAALGAATAVEVRGVFN